MNEREIEILGTSKDQRELKKLANKLAASERKDEIVLLLNFLNNQDFLSRLDNEDDYKKTYTKLRLASVINVLMNNSSEPAYHVILHLIKARVFLGNLLRIQLLIHALSTCRPLEPIAVDFLNGVSVADSPLLYDVIQTLFVNQSVPAMQMLEEKFVHLRVQDDLDKVTWIRDLLLPRRNDEPLLDCFEKVLVRSMSSDFKTEVVDVLFDYKPEKWYVGCRKPQPPPRDLASVWALDILHRIGTYALENVNLSDGQRAKVKKVLESIKF